MKSQRESSESYSVSVFVADMLSERRKVGVSATSLAESDAEGGSERKRKLEGCEAPYMHAG